MSMLSLTDEIAGTKPDSVSKVESINSWRRHGSADHHVRETNNQIRIVDVEFNFTPKLHIFQSAT